VPPDPSSLGDYDIESTVSNEGTGTVYRARHRGTGEVVAVRVIPPATAAGSALERLDREFTILKALKHPNVLRVIDFRRVPRPFLVTELADGASVRQRIERRGAYPEAEALELIELVCAGLQWAHDQGYVHRNVTPGNVLITVTGAVKLDSFNFANPITHGLKLNNPHYMAPEQFRDPHPAHVQGDVYSLGATLYAMVTGVVPFKSASPLDCWMQKIRNEFPSPKDLNPALSERVDRAVCRAMNPDPNKRTASCRAFVAELTGQSFLEPPAPTAADVWYLMYRDENDQPHTVKGSTDGIRRALRDRLLGDPASVLVSRTKDGNFVPLADTPEFRDLVDRS
jgi:eukaryotic-like serine/threonine-protein kinase